MTRINRECITFLAVELGVVASFHFHPRGPGTTQLHTWTGASSDQTGSSPSGKLLHCTPEFNEPLRGSLRGLPTFSFLREG